MGQFDDEIARLRQRLGGTYRLAERQALITQIRELMELDGWQPGALADRVDAVEVELANLHERLVKLTAVIGELVARLEELADQKRPMGFDKN